MTATSPNQTAAADITEGARQLFEQLAQLRAAPVQTLDARTYEVDDRLLNAEYNFGQDGANASGLGRIAGIVQGMPRGEGTATVSLSDNQPAGAKSIVSLTQQPF